MSTFRAWWGVMNALPYWLRDNYDLAVFVTMVGCGGIGLLSGVYVGMRRRSRRDFDE